MDHGPLKWAITWKRKGKIHSIRFVWQLKGNFGQKHFHHLFLLLGERHGALYCNRRLSVHCICFCNLFLLHLLQKVMVIDCWLIYKTRTTDIWNFDSLTLFITIRYIKGFFSGGNLDWKDGALKTTFLKVNYLRFHCREEGSLDTPLHWNEITRHWQDPVSTTQKTG